MSTRAAAPKTPGEYLATIPEGQRTDARRLHRLIRKTAPSLKPSVASEMIGYGAMHVRHASGRKVDWFVVGLASRKNGLALHVMPPADGSPMPEITGARRRASAKDVGVVSGLAATAILLFTVFAARTYITGLSTRPLEFLKDAVITGSFREMRSHHAEPDLERRRVDYLIGVVGMIVSFVLIWPPW